jgi:hypothetical protein
MLRSAQEDKAKRLIVWKEIGCSLIHDHTFARHHFHQTQPPHTVILSEAKDLDFCCCPLHQTQPPHTVILPEAKDPDFCCCPSFIDVFNINIQVLRSAQDDNAKRFIVWKEIGCSLIHDHTSATHYFTLHNPTPLHRHPERSE